MGVDLNPVATLINQTDTAGLSLGLCDGTEGGKRIMVYSLAHLELTTQLEGPDVQI